MVSQMSALNDLDFTGENMLIAVIIKLRKLTVNTRGYEARTNYIIGVCRPVPTVSISIMMMLLTLSLWLRILFRIWLLRL